MYTIRLAAVNTLGPSLETEPVEVSTLPAVPDQVGSLFVSGATPISLVASWIAPESNGQPITMYRVWTCDVQSSVCKTDELTVGFGSATSASNGSDTSVTLSPLTSGRNYTVEVEALNSVGTSGRIAASGIYTTLDVPLKGDPPYRAPTIEGLSLHTTISVRWLPPFDNGDSITGYNLTIDGFSEMRAVPQYTKVGLHPGTSHHFFVRAINGIGQSPESDMVTFWTVADVPGTPPTPVAQSVGTS
eukprot:6901057-Prymnesium_polylepis.1